MEEKFNACLEFLQRKFIRIQREWLHACIEWVVEENNHVPKSNELCNLVYEQWLLADLREIAEAAFPSKNTLLRTKQKEIQGNFCIQVNFVVDIGHSAYSQLQKLKGQEIDYEDAEDDGDNNEAKDFFKKSSENAKMDVKSKTWNEKSSRMLFMELNDGVEMIEAIEYQPINQLTLENIAPGCKLHLVGPILYRDGMFLLKACNVKYLGGNVEQLMESNSQLLILSQLVRPNEREANAEVKTKSGAEGKPNQTIKKIQQCSSNTAFQTHQPAQRKTNTKVKQQKQTVKNNVITTKKEEVSLIPDDLIDDFDDDIIGQLDDNADDLMFVRDEPPTNKNTKTKNTPGDRTGIAATKDFHQPKNNKTRQQTKAHNSFDEFNIPESNFDEFNIPESDFDDDFFVTDDLELLKGKTTHTKTKVPKKENLFSEKKDCDFLDIPDEDSFLDDFDLPDDAIGDEKVTTVAEMVDREQPLKGRFHVKGCFKTLVSGLDFSNGFKLFAILTDDIQCVKVLLGDEALTGLIGFPASKVKQAVSNTLQYGEKEKIKKSVKVAEKSLEMNKWLMDVEFNKRENIYEVSFMKPVYI